MGESRLEKPIARGVPLWRSGRKTPPRACPNRASFEVRAGKVPRKPVNPAMTQRELRGERSRTVGCINKVCLNCVPYGSHFIMDLAETPSPQSNWNRRIRTRMSGGVGAGGSIPPATRLCLRFFGRLDLSSGHIKSVSPSVDCMKIESIRVVEVQTKL